MYTEVKSYQYVIALFKKYGVRNCVLSPGSRNLPFVHSVEQDDYFRCYSVVDERSAGYFALGLAQELNEPVVISCTSSTASCNYYAPVAEAFYQNVPLIVLTSDRDQRMVGQWEDLLIDQVGMYDRHVRKSVNLPVIKDANDEIYCKRLINEALLEMNHNGAKGPIHINIPTDTYNRSFVVKSLPDVAKVERIGMNNIVELQRKKETLLNSNRVLVICGQQYAVSDKLKEQLKMFHEKYNCTILAEHMSNVDLDCTFNPSIIMDTNYITPSMWDELKPEIVLTLGGQIFSGVKEQLKNHRGSFQHWSIQPRGEVVDCFKSLNVIFEAEAVDILTFLNTDVNTVNNGEYDSLFEKEINNVKYPDFRYSHVYAIKNLVERLPEESVLHLSINDSIRIANFFKLPKGVHTYANIGTHGIDGCMSSFIGQSAGVDKPAFLVIGDLAFFYDMNSLKLASVGKNVHILLINNGGGSEFYYNKIQQGDDRHTTAKHHTKAEGWARECGIKYLSAVDKTSFDSCIDEFIGEGPVLMEVFSDMKEDAEVIHEFYQSSRPADLQASMIRTAKEFVKKSIGQEKVKRIVEAFR